MHWTKILLILCTVTIARCSEDETVNSENVCHLWILYLRTIPVRVLVRETNVDFRIYYEHLRWFHGLQRNNAGGLEQYNLGVFKSRVNRYLLGKHVTSSAASSLSISTKSRYENIADAVNDFGYKLLLTMMKQTPTDENIVISPTSIAGLLGMTLLGTVGKTYNELAGALGFSEDIIKNVKNHEQFGELLRSLNANDTSSATLYADALFVDKHVRLRDIYRGFLRRVYNGDVLGVDFHRPGEVKNIINGWVDSHTEGKIEQLLSEPLPVDTKAILLSALYFRGQWETPFLPDYTEKMVFTTPSNEVMSDLMLNMGKFDYIYSQEYDMHMVALPYNDSTTTMYALKPRVPSRLSLNDLMNTLNSAKIDQLIEQMNKAACVIRFPKMDLHRNVRLEDFLRTLGVQSLFIPGTANFALMVDSSAVPNNSDININSRINDEINLVINKNNVENVSSIFFQHEDDATTIRNEVETNSGVKEASDTASNKIEEEQVSKANQQDNKAPKNTEVDAIIRVKRESDPSIEPKVEIASRINGNGEARGLRILESLPNPGLHVDSIIHDVKLKINEYGTEAAAATIGVTTRTAKLFYANTPFYIFIRNEKTKLITFSAIINNPTL